MHLLLDYKVLRTLLIGTSVAFFIAFGSALAQTSPDSAAISLAEKALLRAREAGAERWAHQALSDAQTALDTALDLQSKKRRSNAEQVALRAERLAVLAEAQARHAKMKDAVDRKATENAALRRQLLMGQGKSW